HRRSRAGRAAAPESPTAPSARGRACRPRSPRCDIASTGFAWHRPRPSVAAPSRAEVLGDNGAIAEIDGIASPHATVAPPPLAEPARAIEPVVHGEHGEGGAESRIAER